MHRHISHAYILSRLENPRLAETSRIRSATSHPRSNYTLILLHHRMDLRQKRERSWMRQEKQRGWDIYIPGYGSCFVKFVPGAIPVPDLELGYQQDVRISNDIIEIIGVGDAIAPMID